MLKLSVVTKSVWVTDPTCWKITDTVSVWNRTYLNPCSTWNCSRENPVWGTVCSRFPFWLLPINATVLCFCKNKFRALKLHNRYLSRRLNSFSLVGQQKQRSKGKDFHAWIQIQCFHVLPFSHRYINSGSNWSTLEDCSFLKGRCLCCSFPTCFQPPIENPFVTQSYRD